MPIHFEEPLRHETHTSTISWQRLGLLSPKMSLQPLFMKLIHLLNHIYSVTEFVTFYPYPEHCFWTLSHNEYVRTRTASQSFVSAQFASIIVGILRQEFCGFLTFKGNFARSSYRVSQKSSKKYFGNSWHPALCFCPNRDETAWT